MINLICGLDEAGRGPLAGPVTAGAVILPLDFPVELLNDSKKLTEKKRDKLEPLIKEKALFGVSSVDHKKIDEINILNASLLAMKEAFDIVLDKLPDFLKENNITEYTLTVIADGNKIPPIQGYDVKAVVKADAKISEVMAASILAKVERDRIMYQMDKLYPEYLYSKHKGYPTPEHKKICRLIGPSPIQRLTFKY